MSPWVVLDGARVRLLRDGTVVIPAMLAAIDEAAREILVEMYWFDRDRVGTTMRDALTAAARRGVDVRVVIDAAGSFGTPSMFWRSLRACGGVVEEFGPLLPGKRGFGLGRLFFRNHRKVLVIDAETAFVGGLNFADPWAPSEPEASFRDDVLEVRGPPAADVRAHVAQTWRRLRRPIPEAPRGTGGTSIQVLTNQFGRPPSRRIRRTYLARIRRAASSIDIASAYFLPRPLFVRALCSAAQRGVEVRLMIPARSDVAIVGLASGAILGRLLAAGVRVFAFGPRVLHSKTAVFDQRFVLVGSHNLDALSARFNLECNLLVDSPELAGQVRESFDLDVRCSSELSIDAWRARPVGERILGRLAATLRGYL